MKRNIFKCEVIVDDNGIMKVIPYSNNQLGLTTWLFNNAIQDVVEQINHSADWKKSYIHFSNNGVRYRQIDANKNGKTYCDGCVFYKNTNCLHPHWKEGVWTKGYCTGKIYIKEK